MELLINSPAFKVRRLSPGVEPGNRPIAFIRDEKLRGLRCGLLPIASACCARVFVSSMAFSTLVIFYRSSPWMQTVLTGAGFFADSYDLFAIEGVNNILKALGPSVHVNYNGTTFYFTQYCGDANGTSCLPYLRESVSGAWVPNPNTTYTHEYEPLYTSQSTDNKAIVSNAALIGSILGQLCFGLAGDLLGRKWAFVLSSTLLILGCLGSASAMAGVMLPCAAYVGGMCASAAQQPSSSKFDVYTQLAIWRGILGFGVGGEYPLASTISSEGAKSASRGRSVAMVFSMQGWGKLCAALVNYIVVASCTHFGGSLKLDTAWRISLALGCVPNVLTLWFRYRLHESDIYSKQKSINLNGDELVITAEDKRSKMQAVIPHLSFWTTMRVLWEYRWTLLGTASTWFLIDVTFYGQGLMNTSVVQGAVASTSHLGHPVERLLQSLGGSIIVVLIALPGYWLAILTMDRIGRRPLQVWGFFFEALVFGALALAYTPLRTSGGGIAFVLLYGLTYLFANGGPNSTTFIIPSEAFPTRARATAHGISAATGKLGATVGSFALLELWYSYCTSSRDGSGAPNCSLSNAIQSEVDEGIIMVMWVCAAVSAAGMLFTLLLTKETNGKTLEEIDAGSKVLATQDRILEMEAVSESVAAAEEGVGSSVSAGCNDERTATVGRPPISLTLKPGLNGGFNAVENSSAASTPAVGTASGGKRGSTSSLAGAGGGYGSFTPGPLSTPVPSTPSSSTLDVEAARLLRG